MGPTGDVVRFRIRDIFAPTAEEVLDLLFGDRMLEGQVVGTTMHNQDGPCALVRVAGLLHPVIVPRGSLVSDPSELV